jgi:hypothetical protein
VSNKVGQVELMRPRFAILVVTIAFFLVAPFVRAADVQWPSNFGSFTDAGRIFRNIDPPLNSDPVLRESGFLNVADRAYKQGNHQVEFALYTFRDSSGAFEALTKVRTYPPFAPRNSSPGSHTIYKSNLVLNIASDAELDRATLKAVEDWLKSISDGVPAPPLADYLPNQNQSNARYALGPAGFREYANEIGSQNLAALADSTGFDSHAEAMFGKYKSGKEEATLLLIDYPTPQLAELHMRHLRRALADAKLTSSSIERKGSLLSIVLAPTSAEYAEKLRGSVNYETQVTWNEARQVATDPPILSTVAKIFIATGVFMVVTVVIGIAFGGVRIITKRLFPGKVFDRKEQLEVLQLGLGSKPIDPSDMY